VRAPSTAYVHARPITSNISAPPCSVPTKFDKQYPVDHVNVYSRQFFNGVLTGWGAEKRRPVTPTDRPTECRRRSLIDAWEVHARTVQVLILKFRYCIPCVGYNRGRRCGTDGNSEAIALCHLVCHPCSSTMIPGPYKIQVQASRRAPLSTSAG
jgi:hypothetical protein